MRLDRRTLITRTHAGPGIHEVTVLCSTEAATPHVGDEVQLDGRLYRMTRLVWPANGALGAIAVFHLIKE